MGYAMGCIGLSFNDFCLMHPSEFGVTCDAFQLMHEQNEKAAWERLRVQTTITLQPFLIRKITAKELLPLPWDERPHVTVVQSPGDKTSLQYAARDIRWLRAMRTLQSEKAQKAARMLNGIRNLKNKEKQNG